MKHLVLVLTGLSLAASIPQYHFVKLGFRNLYKEPIKEKSIEPGLGIVNGNEAVPHSIPYQALLRVTRNGKVYVCGGSLISQNYVLSSASCLNEGVKVKVVLGAHSIRLGEDTQVSFTLFAEHITVHENYDAADFTQNNIAVLNLPSPVSLTDAIQPVKLPSRSDRTNQYTGVVAKASGWGTSGGNDTSVSDVLMYVCLEVISNDECSRSFGNIDETLLCTSGKDDTGICGGDIGGPLVTDNVQIGVSSFVASGCQAQYPSGFTRVTSFLDWIQEHSDVIID